MNKDEGLKFVAFSAVLKDKQGQNVPVRITAQINHLAILSNVDIYDVENNFLNLNDIEVEDIY